MAPRMTINVPAVTGYHAHIYYDEASRYRAQPAGGLVVVMEVIRGNHQR